MPLSWKRKELEFHAFFANWKCFQKSFLLRVQWRYRLAKFSRLRILKVISGSIKWGGLGFPFKIARNVESRTSWACPSVFCDKPVSWKNVSEEVRSVFLEQNVIRLHQTKLCVDGSKLNSDVGCAFIHENATYVCKLCDCASLFTAK